MRLHSPPITELHALAAVARLGSVSLAANELSVTQGAISRAITRLEDHLGCPLLVRGNRRVGLTEAGKAFLDKVGPALDMIEDASSQLRMGARTKELTLSVAPTFFSNWLVPRLYRYEALHPNITLRFVHYEYGGCDFSGQTPDAVISAKPLDIPLVSCDYVIGRRIIPVCSPQIALGIKTPRDLLNQKLLYQKTTPYYWSDWFKAAGVTGEEPTLGREFDYVSILIEAAFAGLGVAILPYCLLEQALELGRLVTPFDLAIESKRGFHLCYPKAKSDMIGLTTFKDWLMDEVATYCSSVGDSYEDR
ncbi:MAG TPA: LysR substrate-binding domain-containing protein [Burkholderiaceae bacterium]|jgi:DNA-binding transcriptional LysR family regulator